jgi:hypothetical protein
VLVDRTADAATNSGTRSARSGDNPELRIIATVAECGLSRIVARHRHPPPVDLRGEVGTGKHIGRLPLEDAADSEARRSRRHGRPDAGGGHGRRDEAR